MLFSMHSLAPGFYADEFHFLVFEKPAEDPNRVASSSYAGNNSIRHSSFCLFDLRLCLLSYHALKMSHHRWEWMRAKHRPKKIMGVSHICRPIAKRLIDGVF